MNTLHPVRILSIASAAFLLAATSACYRPVASTATISVPQIRSDDCGRLAAESLRSMQGVTGVNIVPQRSVLEVTYDNTKLGLKNLERAIALAGFDANDTPASPEARQRLPEGCR